VADISTVVDALNKSIGAHGAGSRLLYKRLQNGLRTAIESGVIGHDEVLPSERNLAAELGLSRVTVRRAVRELAAEGLLLQRQGAGTFVAPRLEQPLSVLTSYTEGMIAPTKMAVETGEAPEAVRRLLRENAPLCNDLAERLRGFSPRFMVTCARGSSDHAATFAKYLFETHLGVPTASFAPSISSLYQSRLNLEGAVFLVISQSGRSPDLCISTRAARAAGALVVVLCNDTTSPLAELADVCLPLWADPELSVAATKSFIASLAGLLQIAATWSGEKALLSALSKLPDQLAMAAELSWQPAVETFAAADHALIVGRGLGYAVAQEAALKFKETSRLHAEPFSAAELSHGPMALMSGGFPVLMFGQNDQTRTSTQETMSALRAKGGRVFVAPQGAGDRDSLPVVGDVHPACAPATFVQSFYAMANSVALARGLNPDSPPHLSKVTETV
jgi:glutamine---fructose-6-phosphate transaminase (isomerizing)